MTDIFYHGAVVAFDLDDTLFREREFCRSGFRFLCNPERHAIPHLKSVPDSESISNLLEKMNNNLIARENPFSPFEKFFYELTLPEYKESFDLQSHISAYRSHLPDKLELAPEVEETLLKLVDDGVCMALITDGRSTTQRRKIEALGLERFISPDLIFISEETGVDKLQPDMFASVVRHFPEASGFYYVGDNPLKDFYHPNLLGWTTLQVPPHQDNVHPVCPPPTPLHTPRIVLNKFSDLISHVMK